MPIAIKGKVRSHLTRAERRRRRATLEKLALADARVQELIAGKTVHKVIVVPGKHDQHRGRLRETIREGGKRRKLLA